MGNDDGFIEFLHELLEPLGVVSTRRMFGGHGVYCDGVFIAIVVDGKLYLKVDGETSAAFARAGSAPFVYESKGTPVQMSYWNAPEEALDSPEQMRPWARLAIDAALRKPAAAKAARKQRKLAPSA